MRWPRNGTDPGFRLPGEDETHRKMLINVGLVISCLGLAGAYAIFVRSEARAQADAGVEAARRIGHELEEHKTSEREENLLVRQDIRDLYKFMLTRERQARLERAPSPAADGGQ